MLDTFCGQLVDGGLCGWPYIWHIVVRFCEHVGLGGSLLIAVVLVMHECMRRRWIWRMRPLSLVVCGVILALLFIGQREAFDVRAGDEPIKSVIDGVSWATGMMLAAVGVYRAIPIINGAASDYQEWQRRRRETYR